MRNWDTRDESDTGKGCEWEKDWKNVQRICAILDIPCKLVSACLLATRLTDVLQVDLSRDYWNRVFEPSLCQLEMGNTLIQTCSVTSMEHSYCRGFILTHGSER